MTKTKEGRIKIRQNAVANNVLRADQRPIAMETGYKAHTFHRHRHDCCLLQDGTYLFSDCRWHSGPVAVCELTVYR